MTARALRRCPTCKRALDDDVRSKMGLRTGEALNALCPGLTGPSDIDHVLHNGKVTPERLLFIEYKAPGVQPSAGQAWLLRSLTGSWTSDDGRAIDIRHVILDDDAGEQQLHPLIEWLWPSEVAV